MKKLLIAAALLLSACTSNQLITVSGDLTGIANVLNATATDLPTACTNLNAAIDNVSATPNLPSKIVSALDTGNAKYTGYCLSGAAFAGATGAVITDINNFIQQLAAQLKTQGQ
jgi:hypothetical protein